VGYRYVLCFAVGLRLMVNRQAHIGDVWTILGVAAFTAIVGIGVDLVVQQLPILSALYSAAANGGSGLSTYIGCFLASA